MQVKAAAEAAVAGWLAGPCGGDALALLELLDVETYPGARHDLDLRYQIWAARRTVSA
jgi:hypothetical protein